VIAFGDNGVRRADLAAVARVAAGAPELLQGRTAFNPSGVPDDGRQPSSRPGFRRPSFACVLSCCVYDSDQQSSEEQPLQLSTGRARGAACAHSPSPPIRCAPLVPRVVHNLCSLR